MSDLAVLNVFSFAVLFGSLSQAVEEYISTFTLHPPHIPPAFRLQHIPLAGYPTSNIKEFVLMARTCKDLFGFSSDRLPSAQH